MRIGLLAYWRISMLAIHVILKFILDPLLDGVLAYWHIGVLAYWRVSDKRHPEICSGSVIMRISMLAFWRFSVLAIHVILKFIQDPLLE